MKEDCNLDGEYRQGFTGLTPVVGMVVIWMANIDKVLQA